MLPACTCHNLLCSLDIQALDQCFAILTSNLHDPAKCWQGKAVLSHRIQAVPGGVLLQGIVVHH